MTIAGRSAHKSTHHKTTAARRPTKRRGSSFRGRPNWFVRMLSHLPKWLLWLVSVLIALVYVVFILSVVLHFSMPWKAMYGTVPEPGGYPVRGIDISHYQSDIHWEELASGTLDDHLVRFVLIKGTEGTTIFDNAFNENFHNARQYGFIRGAYHFFIPGSDAKAQAKYFLSQVHLQVGDLPPVLDVETTGGLSVKELQDAARKWLTLVGNHYGVKPIIYTNYAFKMKYLDTPEFDAYPFWIAHYYKDTLEYKGKWVLWQYTDCGRISGINERVDCNVFNGSLQELTDLCITKEQYPVEY